MSKFIVCFLATIHAAAAELSGSIRQ